MISFREDAIVLTDAIGLELIAWQGIEWDMIRSLDFVDGLENQHVAVLISDHLSKAHSLLKYIASQRVKSLDVYCFYSESVHVFELDHDEALRGVWSDHDETALDLGYFDSIKASLEKLNLPNTTTVQSIDSCVCNVATDFFLLPSATDVNTTLNDNELGHLNSRKVGALLSTYMDSANIRDEVFAIGATARRISQYIVGEGQSSQRRSSENDVAIVIVDRIFDLVAPSLYSENLLDILFDSHPRNKPTSFDCNVPLSSILPDMNDEVYEKDSTVPLSHGQDSRVLHLIDELLRLPQRESLIYLRSTIFDFVVEFVDPTVLEPNGRVTAEQLKELVDYLKNKPSLLLKHETLMTYCIALVDAYSSNLSIREELLSNEKIMVALLAQTGETCHIIYQLHDLLAKIVKDRREGKSNEFSMSTRDVLLLTLHMYSMVGNTLEFEEQHETLLKDAFVAAMLSTNPKANSRAVTAWVAKVFVQFKKVTQCRAKLNDFNCLLDLDSISPYTPFLVKVAQAIREPPSQSITPDIEHIPYRGSITSVLTGFSRLIGQVVHPSTFSTVIIFVSGGITFKEVAQIQAIGKEKGIRIIVGSTTICNRAALLTSL